MNRKVEKSDGHSFEAPSKKRVEWLDNWALGEVARQNLKTPKTAVQVAQERTSPHPLYPIPKGAKTVESVVQELRERSGVQAMMDRKKTAQTLPQSPVVSSNPQIVQNQNKNQVFGNISPQLRENIMSFLKNKIEAHRGNISLPALQEEVLATFKSDGIDPSDVNNDAAGKVISDMITNQNQLHPGQDDSSAKNMLGKSDNSQSNDSDDNSFFSSLMTSSH